MEFHRTDDGALCFELVPTLISSGSAGPRRLRTEVV